MDAAAKKKQQQRYVIAAAVVLVIVIGIVIYVTRKTPAPTTLPPLTEGHCRTDGDCTRPLVCNTGSGVCFDPELPVLIVTAQKAVMDLHITINNVITPMLNSTVFQNAQTLKANAGKMGLASPDISTLRANIDTAMAQLDLYAEYVEVPECINDGGGDSCGVYTDIMALTTTSPATTIWNVGQNASVVLNQLPAFLKTLPAVISDLNRLASSVKSDAASKKKTLDAATATSLSAVQSGAWRISEWSGILTSEATTVRDAGFALYSHYFL